MDWRKELEKAWPTARFGRVTVKTSSSQHRFDIELQPDSLNPDAVHAHGRIRHVLPVSDVVHSLYTPL